jgi:hypothetical protein
MGQTSIVLAETKLEISRVIDKVESAALNDSYIDNTIGTMLIR